MLCQLLHKPVMPRPHHDVPTFRMSGVPLGLRVMESDGAKYTPRSEQHNIEGVGSGHGEQVGAGRHRGMPTVCNKMMSRICTASRGAKQRGHLADARHRRSSSASTRGSPPRPFPP